MTAVPGLDQLLDGVIHPAARAAPSRRQSGLLVGRTAPDGELTLVIDAIPLTAPRPAVDEIVGWFAIRPGDRAALPAAGSRPDGGLVVVVDPANGVEAAYVETARGRVRLYHRAFAADTDSASTGRSLLWTNAAVLLAVLVIGVTAGFAAWQLVA
jgi:hypothetical protein